MIKELIINKFTEEKSEVLNLYEKYLLAKDKDIPVFGNNFYTPNVWKFFDEYVGNDMFKVETYGIFEECERRMISFNNIYNTEFPVKCIKITNKSKFAELKHKDYLGAILALGIERSKLGDLIVENDCCFVAVHEEILDYILYNLDKIGKSTCKVEVIEDYKDFPKINLKEEFILIPSLRIDAVVSKICNSTRAKAVSLVEQGLVLVDYNKIREKSYEVKKDERITVRKSGKYIIGDIIGTSKSGKLKLQIKKYT